MTWRWIPLAMPFEHLPEIVGKLSGARLRPLPDADTTGAWPERVPLSEPVNRAVTAAWSSAACTLTVREDHYSVWDRGEDLGGSRQRARVRWHQDDVTLFIEEPEHYRVDGPAAAAAEVERRWLELLKTRFFRPTWKEHALVPAAWRKHAEEASFVPRLERANPWAWPPIRLLSRDGRSWGILFSTSTEALPFGPLPGTDHALVIEYERPGGAEAWDLPAMLSGLLDDPPAWRQTARTVARLDQPVALLSVHATSVTEIVTFEAWRAGDWILRSQIGREHGAALSDPGFRHEWALQHEAGEPWAVMGRRHRLGGDVREYQSVCIMADAARAARLAGRWTSVLAPGGWTREGEADVP